MDIENQLRNGRKRLGLSQEGLAEAVGVSRQTVSNWENSKSYPDLGSLLKLSDLFEISLDNLIKGDITMMKTEISQEARNRFNRESILYAILLTMMIFSAMPLIIYLGRVGIAIWAVIVVLGVIEAFRVDRLKKEHNIQTYKEITAFIEGKTLTEAEKQQEAGKYIYQKVAIVGAVTLVTVIVCMLFNFFLA